MIRIPFFALLILLALNAAAARPLKPASTAPAEPEALKPFELPPKREFRRLAIEWRQVTSPDGTLFATGDDSGVAVWKVGDSKPTARITWPLDASFGELLPLAISKDNKRVLMHRKREMKTVEVAVADLETEKIIGALPPWTTRTGSDGMKGIRRWENLTGTFSPDGATASYRSYYMIEDALNGYDDVLFTVEGKVLEKKTRKVKWVDSKWVDASGGDQGACRYVAAGSRVAVRTDGASCSVIDCGTGKRTSFLDGCDRLSYSAPELSSDGTRVTAALGSADSATKWTVWDAVTGQTIRTLEVKDEAPYQYSTVQFDDTLHYAVFMQKYVAEARVQALRLDLFSVDTGERLARTESAVDSTHYLRYLAPDGSAAFLSVDGVISMWPLATARPAGAKQALARVPVPELDVDRAPQTAVKLNPNAYAVVVGVEKYRQAGIPVVDFAARDAKAMYDYLTVSMGFDPKNVVSLTNGEATKTDFEKHFGKWLKNRVDVESRVFVYYAGHGAPNPATGEGYLMPYEADPSYLEETAYPVARVYSELAKLPTKDITVVLDACFSGQGQRSLIAQGTRPLVAVKPAKAPGNLVVIAAASGTQVSVSDHAAQHGLLTYHLLAGLQGAADADKDGNITASEVFTYARPAVERAARLQNVEQTPMMSGDGSAASAWITRGASGK